CPAVHATVAATLPLRGMKKPPSDDPMVATGSGGGIRTRDLWVMSPTSCRCSTPRCLRTRETAIHPFGCVRSGLTSHAVPRAVLSGAAMGHDQVRDGDWVGPWRSRPRTHPKGCIRTC